MKKWILCLAVAGFSVVAISAVAQAPAGTPAGANGICKDGTYSMDAKKAGACRGHKGVQTWYATDVKAATAAVLPAPAKPAPAAMAAKPAAAPMATVPATATPAAKKGPAAAAAAKKQAAGGGPGLVWVNTESNVYHCNGDTYYGKTKAGSYMSEADAKAKGARGERGKTCGGK